MRYVFKDLNIRFISLAALFQVYMKLLYQGPIIIAIALLCASFEPPSDKTSGKWAIKSAKNLCALVVDKYLLTMVLQLQTFVVPGTDCLCVFIGWFYYKTFFISLNGYD